MSALGMLLLHAFRPGLHSPDFLPRDRSGPVHFTGRLDSIEPPVPPAYLPDWAHYPVRLNGRECHTYAGVSETKCAPFAPAPQAITNAFGRNQYHAHSIPILWTAAAGPRTFTAHVRHTVTAGPLPKITLEGRSDLGIVSQTVTAGPATDTDHPLVINLTMPTQATLTIRLESDNTTEDIVVTWGDLLTT